MLSLFSFGQRFLLPGGNVITVTSFLHLCSFLRTQDKVFAYLPVASQEAISALSCAATLQDPFSLPPLSPLTLHPCPGGEALKAASSYCRISPLRFSARLVSGACPLQSSEENVAKGTARILYGSSRRGKIAGRGRVETGTPRPKGFLCKLLDGLSLFSALASSLTGALTSRVSGVCFLRRISPPLALAHRFGSEFDVSPVS